jgi:hypothetical protein
MVVEQEQRLFLGGFVWDVPIASYGGKEPAEDLTLGW